MGLLRVYLALCVVSAHSTSILPWGMHDGRQAVEVFFMISGFYMAMVLSQGYNSRKDFYLSRFLRIYVPYFVTLFIVICLSLAIGIYSGNWLGLTPYLSHPLAQNGMIGFVLASGSNLTVFFQDTVMFLSQDAGAQIGFTSNFRDSHYPLYNYLLMPQCWSVALELSFYVVAPFLNKLSSRYLLGILSVSLLIRIFFYEILKLDHDPWDYRFFPFEIAFFVAGMLSWRFYVKVDFEKKFRPLQSSTHFVLGYLITLTILMIHAKTVSKISSQINFEYCVLIGYPAFFFSLPVVFACFRKNHADRFIGELSYPIYLSHLFVIDVVRLSSRGNLSELNIGRISALLATTLSVILFVTLLKPFEKWRRSYINLISNKDRQLTGPLP